MFQISKRLKELIRYNKLYTPTTLRTSTGCAAAFKTEPSHQNFQDVKFRELERFFSQTSFFLILKNSYDILKKTLFRMKMIFWLWNVLKFSISLQSEKSIFLSFHHRALITSYSVRFSSLKFDPGNVYRNPLHEILSKFLTFRPVFSVTNSVKMA